MSKTLWNVLIALSKTEALPIKTARARHVECDPLRFIFEHAGKLDEAREKYFIDAQSRRVFDWILQSRVVRYLYRKPGMPEPDVLDNIPYTRHQWARLLRQASAMEPVVANDYLLDRIDIWLLESYSMPGRCEVEPGDTVIDGGAYTGNSSVYFSKKTGPSGHVYGFEPLPETFAFYSENVRPYTNVTAVNAGLTGKDALTCPTPTMAFSDHRFGSRFSENGPLRVPVTAIDAFVKERGVPRVDFIKLDVESAEADVLKGAAETIRAHHPKMAISAYHKEEDIFVLPEIISGICPDYRFALRHFSDGACETVMFCRHGGDRACFGEEAPGDERPINVKTLCKRIEIALNRLAVQPFPERQSPETALPYFPMQKLEKTRSSMASVVA